MQEIKEKWGGVLSLGVEKEINTEEKERGEANATKDIYKSLEKSYYIYLHFLFTQSYATWADDVPLLPEKICRLFNNNHKPTQNQV